MLPLSITTLLFGIITIMSVLVQEIGEIVTEQVDSYHMFSCFNDALRSELNILLLLLHKTVGGCTEAGLL